MSNKWADVSFKGRQPRDYLLDEEDAMGDLLEEEELKLWPRTSVNSRPTPRTFIPAKHPQLIYHQSGRASDADHTPNPVTVSTIVDRHDYIPYVPSQRCTINWAC